MATIDLATRLGEGLAPSRHANAKVPYLVEVNLDLAEAVTEKGSALANGDVMQVIDVPAETLVIAAGFEVTTAMTGTSTDATFDMGITGVDVDVWVDGFDIDGASAGDHASQPAAYQPIVVGGTADTIDVLIASQTGTILTGVLRCWALMVDLKPQVKAGIAAPGS